MLVRISFYISTTDINVSLLIYIFLLGRNIIFMAVEAIGFFTMVLLSEMELFRSFRRYWAQNSLRGFVPEVLTKEIDIDVAGEMVKVKAIIQSTSLAGPGEPKYSVVNSEEEKTSNLDDQVEQLSSSRGEIEMQSFEIARNTSSAIVDPRAATDNRDAENYSLVMSCLGKIYPPTILSGQPKHALRDLSLALKPGERFGLLGVNGAGKSTTMAILTGDTDATTGLVFVAGRPLDDPKTRLSIGFCPQTDPVRAYTHAYTHLDKFHQFFKYYFLFIVPFLFVRISYWT